jgi:AcrR family transcriptional regulator
MPKVHQDHLDARRRQIIDAARARFASHGFARTSMADIVTQSELSTGAIYRYFKSKDEIVVAVCEQGDDILPRSLTAEALSTFLEALRTRAREQGHARLVTQIYAEAAISPTLALIVQKQLDAGRARIAELVRAERGSTGPDDNTPEQIAEAFIAICTGFHQQLAVRGDLDPAPFTRALLAVVR